LLRLAPGLGVFLEKAGFCMMGDVPKLPAESALCHLLRRFKNTSLNTFDLFGSHKYQHHKSNNEICALVNSMQPDSAKVFNMDRYFLRPALIGCALRVTR